MKKLKDAINHNHLFWVLVVFSIGLIVAGFIVPPMGVIDGSVLTAIGLLLGFAALDSVNRAMANGATATARYKDVEVKIDGDGDGKGK